MNAARLGRVLLLALGVHATACATVLTTTRDDYEPLGVDTQMVAGRDWRVGGEWLPPSSSNNAALGVHVFRYRPCEKHVSERQLHVRTTERLNDTKELTLLSLLIGGLGATMVGVGVQRTVDGESFTEKDPADPKKPTPGQEVLLGSALSLFLVGATVDIVRSLDSEESWAEVNSRTEPMQCERQDLAGVKVALSSGETIVQSSSTDAKGQASFDPASGEQNTALGVLVNGERITDLGPPPAAPPTEDRFSGGIVGGSNVEGVKPDPPLAKRPYGTTLWGVALRGMTRRLLEVSLLQRGILVTESAANRQTYRLSATSWLGLTQLLVLWDSEQHLVGMALTGEQTPDEADRFKTDLNTQFGAARNDSNTPGRLVWDLGGQVEAAYLVTSSAFGKQQVHFSITDLQAEQRVRQQIQDRGE